MKCSVVVRVLNEKENLHKLINILEKQKKIEFELIVVDSGSDDGTVEMLESFQFKYPPRRLTTLKIHLWLRRSLCKF